jgi:hypothetical protein
MVRGGAPIEQRARPAAAFIADLPVFDVPRGDAFGGELRRQRGRILERGIALGPAAAMDDDRDGKRAYPDGQPQLAELNLIRD